MDEIWRSVNPRKDFEAKIAKLLNDQLKAKIATVDFFVMKSRATKVSFLGRNIHIGDTEEVVLILGAPTANVVFSDIDLSYSSAAFMENEFHQREAYRLFSMLQFARDRSDALAFMPAAEREKRIAFESEQLQVNVSELFYSMLNYNRIMDLVDED
jgi:hypothetical protein